jgi:hypothetical protein
LSLKPKADAIVAADLILVVGIEYLVGEGEDVAGAIAGGASVADDLGRVVFGHRQLLRFSGRRVHYESGGTDSGTTINNQKDLNRSQDFDIITSPRSRIRVVAKVPALSLCYLTRL